MDKYDNYREDYYGHNVPRAVREEIKEMISHREDIEEKSAQKKGLSSGRTLFNAILPVVTTLGMVGVILYMIARELDAL